MIEVLGLFGGSVALFLCGDELRAFHGFCGTSLEGFALFWCGEGGDGADVLVGGEGWEDFAEEDGVVGLRPGGESDNGVTAGDDRVGGMEMREGKGESLGVETAMRPMGSVTEGLKWQVATEFILPGRYSCLSVDLD